MALPFHKINDMVYHWSAYSDKHKMELSSHLLKSPEGCILIDPVMPENGDMDSILEAGPPEAIIILSENHTRDCQIFRDKFSIPVWISQPSASKLTFSVDKTFRDQEELPGGFLAVVLGEPTKGESVLVGYRILAFGDVVYNRGKQGGLALLSEKFAPNQKALKKAIEKLVVYQFETVVFGHGDPLTQNVLEEICQVLI